MVTKKDIRFFSMARDVSQLSTHKRHQLGCVVVYKRKYVLSEGYNMGEKTSPLQGHYNTYRDFQDGKYVKHSIHAEIMAISKIRYLDIDFSDLSIYIYRELKDGTVAIARPCKACMSAIKDIGIHNVWYTTQNGYAYEKIIEV